MRDRAQPQAHSRLSPPCPQLELGTGPHGAGDREGQVDQKEPILSGPVHTLRGLGWEEGRVPGSGHKDGAEWVPAMLPAKVPAKLGSGARWGEVWMQGRSSQTKSEQMQGPGLAPHTAALTLDVQRCLNRSCY